MHPTTRPTPRLAVAVTLLLTGIVMSCGCAGNRPVADDRPARPSASAHAADAAELRAVMRELERLTFETLPEQFDTESARTRHFEEIRRVADDLAQTTSAIPEGIDEFDLSDEQADYFRWLAERLRADVIGLRDRAASGELGSMNEEIEPIVADCNACHTTFRIDPMGMRGAED